MKTIFWLAIAAIFMTSGRITQAQDNANDVSHLLQLGDPAELAATNARIEQSNLLRQQGRAALKKGDIPKAVSLFEQALKAFEFDSYTRIVLSDIYTRQGKTEDAIRILRPVFYHDSHMGNSDEYEVTTRMKYVLTLLAKTQWEEAVTIYEGSFGASAFGQSKNGELKWQIPGGSPEHTVPEKHFSADSSDVAGLLAQAHLILGCREQVFMAEEDRLPYMLDHLKQAIKYDRFSLDAHFLMGVVLGKMERFDEARAAFKQTDRLAPEEAKPEIVAALKDLKVLEEQKKARDAFKAAQKADAVKQVPQTTEP